MEKSLDGNRRWIRLRRNGMAMTGLMILLSLTILAISAPYLGLDEPNQVNTATRLRPPLSEGHLLGTDEFGRDMFSRLVWGGRTSLVTGLLAAGISAVSGVVLGVAAGFFGGKIDSVIMRGTDVLMSFPYILLAIAIAAALGPGLTNAMIAIGITGMPIYIRTVRSSALTVMNQEFITAARSLGAHDGGIAWRHLMPNLLSPITVIFSLDVGTKIIATASLSFLGLGPQPPLADWGSMLANGRTYLALAPHVATLPGVLILVVVLGCNLLGDGIRDALDPRLRI
jgi:peptide/nickel transport system permease protein